MYTINIVLHRNMTNLGNVFIFSSKITGLTIIFQMTLYPMLYPFGAFPHLLIGIYLDFRIKNYSICIAIVYLYVNQSSKWGRKAQRGITGIINSAKASSIIP